MFIPLYCRGRYYPPPLYTPLGKVCLSLYTAGINMANLIRLEYLTSALCTWNIPWNLLHNSYKPMLLILDGNSEKGEHVWSEICNLKTFVYSESSCKFKIYFRKYLVVLSVPYIIIMRRLNDFMFYTWYWRMVIMSFAQEGR